MRASVGEIASVPGGSEFFIRFLESNAEISKREGHPVSEGFLEEYRKLFRDKRVAYVPSLLRDIERHHKTEGDHIIGFMLGLARKHGLDDTLYRIMAMHLNAYEIRRATGRL
jgi:2-dehydropantoate 2-reductase